MRQNSNRFSASLTVLDIGTNGHGSTHVALAWIGSRQWSSRPRRPHHSYVAAKSRHASPLPAFTDSPARLDGSGARRSDSKNSQMFADALAPGMLGHGFKAGLTMVKQPFSSSMAAASVVLRNTTLAALKRRSTFLRSVMSWIRK